jgi:hypothetical protein
VAQTTDEKQLQHLSRGLLHAIHEIFPLPSVTGHAGEERISIKKLIAGNKVWAVQKEILGWLFDGVRRCIQLPESKVTALLQELHQAAAFPERNLRSSEANYVTLALAFLLDESSWDLLTRH